MKNKFQIHYDMWHGYRALSFRVLTLVGVIVFILKSFDLVGGHSHFIILSVAGCMAFSLVTIFKTAFYSNQDGVKVKEDFQSELRSR